MPLELIHTRPKKTLKISFYDTSPAEMYGNATYDGVKYIIRLSRNSTSPTDHYAMVEIQQLTHSPEEAIGAELGDDHFDNVIPLPKGLRSLEGDTLTIAKDSTAHIYARFAAPWIWPDADGNYPDKPKYTLKVLQAKLTNEQGDQLFGLMKQPTWTEILEEQRGR